MRKFRSGETAKVRSVVQVLVKDKDSDEYCWIRHTHDGDISAFFGGVDEGELPIDAAIREVAEE